MPLGRPDPAHQPCVYLIISQPVNYVCRLPCFDILCATRPGTAADLCGIVMKRENKPTDYVSMALRHGAYCSTSQDTINFLLDDKLIAGVSKFLACFGNGSCWCGAPRSFVLRAH